MLTVTQVKPKKGKKKQPQQREQDDELEESDEEVPAIAKQGGDLVYKASRLGADGDQARCSNQCGIEWS
jgi:hypothetical protein